MSLSTDYAIGDTYCVRGCDFVVAQRTRIRRGKMTGGWEILLAPLGQMRGRKSAYAMRAQVRVGSQHVDLKAARGTYDQADKDKAIAAAVGTKEAIQERKEANAEAGREVITGTEQPSTSSSTIEVGDTVKVKYVNAIRDEECVGVNLATGKIAIRTLSYASGKRWIPATLAIGIKKASR